MLGNAKKFFGDRIQLCAVLIVVSFVAVLVLSSQSAASYPSYLLLASMLVTVRHWHDVLKTKFVWLVIAVLSWLALSAFWSEPFQLRDAFSIWIRVALILSFVIAFAECQLRGQLQTWVAQGLTLTGIGAVLLAIGNFFVTDPADGRLNGMGQLDTHVIAALIYGVVALFALQQLIVAESWLRKLAYGSAVVAIIIAIVLSDSRNAWVSFGIGAVLLTVGYRAKAPGEFAVSAITILGVGFIGLLIALLDAELRDLILPRGDSFRLEIWQGVLERVGQDSWALGRGILSPEQVVSSSGTFDHPHNMYLAILDQGGLVGLVLYLSMIVSTAVVLLTNFRYNDAKLGISILGLGLSAHLLDGHELVDKVGASWFLIWLPVAIALGFCWRSEYRRTGIVD